MANEKGCQIIGSLRLEGCDKQLPGDALLAAYAFDPEGRSLGNSVIDSDGDFRFGIKDSPKAVTVSVGLADDEASARDSALYSQRFELSGRERPLEVRFWVPTLTWRPWWPRRICISGHVRKIPFCPVPFAKVEIFDVDRELCYWRLAPRFKDLVRERRAITLEELQREFPDLPDLLDPPGTGPLEAAGLDTGFDGSEVGFNPQPEPPRVRRLASAVGDTELTKTANRLVNPDLPELTLSAKLAPWVLYPRCFYSRQLLCTTTTNQHGYFKCCFRWYPFHIRHGHLRYDARPDILLRVTQVIDGVSKVIYLDPYASTRWNSPDNLHIDLFLDDPDIECGSGENPDRPAGTDTFFTRIGNDEVYKIDQGDGTYDALGSYSNMAYGSALRIFAQFGDTLSEHKNISGAKKPYFYKVSVDGVPITQPLKDTRVNKATLLSEAHVLGPVSRGSESALYEIRDFDDYYWYNPDWIAHWITATSAGDTVTKNTSDGLKTLRLEVFDNDGKLLDDSKVNYVDGTVAPPAVLPAHYPCTMQLAVDNNPPQASFSTHPLPSGCGVIPFENLPPLTFSVDVSQSLNRVYSWRLSYVKGTDPSSTTLAVQNSPAGTASVSAHPVSGGVMLNGLSSTCAFAVKLFAEAHIRNGYGQIYDREFEQALAIEMTPPCECD